MKVKGERLRYAQPNAEFQRIARRDKKVFLSEQFKETEENNRMENIRYIFKKIRDTPGGSDGKPSACSAEDLDSIPGSGRYPGEGNGNPLQHSCLDNPMIRGA